MGYRPKQFAEKLKKALLRIRAETGKSLGQIKDEIGHDLYRPNGPSYLGYLQRGNVPQIEDLAPLAATLAHRGGFASKRELEEFLRDGGEKYAAETAHELWLQPTSPRYSASGGSPFVAGPPLRNPQQFVGRERELRRLFSHWRKTPLEHVAIIGPRRSGKTSLLHQAIYLGELAVRGEPSLDWMMPVHDCRWISFDMLGALAQTQSRFLALLLQKLGIAWEGQAPCTVEAFAEAVIAFPVTIPTVIVLDEIVAPLESAEFGQDFWWTMRAWAQEADEGLLAFVVTAHKSPMRLAEELGKVSPFFNMFHALHLGPLSRSEAESLVNCSPVPFPVEDRDWILETSQGWPNILQILCQHLYRRLEQGQSVTTWREDALRELNAMPDCVNLLKENR